MRTSMRWSSAVAFAAALSGCFNSSSFTPYLEQSTITTGMTTATVHGRNFAPGIQIYWNGKPKPSRYADNTTAQFDLDVDETRVATTADLTAANEGSYLSPPLHVSVIDASLALTSLSSGHFALGSPETVLTVNGTGFTPDAQVLWNDTPLVTTFSSSTSVDASIPASSLAVAGDNLIRVQRCHSTFCETSNPVTCSVGTATLNIVQQGAVDLAWDATHATIYTAGSSGSNSGVTPLDPVSLDVGATVPAPSVGGLSISDNDQYLYVASWDGDVFRYELPGLGNMTTIPLTTGARSVAAVPGTPTSVAFAIGGAGIIDGTVLRQKFSNFYIQSVAWGPDSSTLFGIGSGLWLLAVDPTGITSTTLLNSNAFYYDNHVYYDRTMRRLYGDKGTSFDESGAGQQTFPLPGTPGYSSPCVGAVDGELGKAFFACTETGFGAWPNPGLILTIRSFDLGTQQPIAMVLLQPYLVYYSVNRIVRWGNDGLAVATDRAIYLFNGQFVR